MKRLLLLLMLCLVLVVPAMALTETLQDWSYSFNTISNAGTSTFTSIATTGANTMRLYMPAFTSSLGYRFIGNPTPTAMTYSAADLIAINAAGQGYRLTRIQLYDTADPPGLLYEFSTQSQNLAVGRMEMKMIGGQATIFNNGCK